MSDLKLQPDELELLASYENDEWQLAKNIKDQKEQYRLYARAMFRKDKRVNIRISEKDLLDLQKRALREGIPYQSLISRCTAQVRQRDASREITQILT